MIPENVKSLNTLSMPILGICRLVLTKEMGLHLTCMELLIIQSALNSRVLASLLKEVWALRRMFFLTLFMVVKVKSMVEVAALSMAPA